VVRDFRYSGIVSASMSLVLGLRDQNMICLFLIGHNTIDGPDLGSFNMLERVFHMLHNLFSGLVTARCL
jgi:hypothetical protein